MGFMMLFWVIIAAVVILAVLRLHPPGRDYRCEYGPDLGRDPESPREIARRRYAKGELTKEQFEQLMKDLG